MKPLSLNSLLPTVTKWMEGEDLAVRGGGGQRGVER